jgi:hypothetical protein
MLRQDGKVNLFLVLFGCAGIARHVRRGNSGFSGPNSRLAANKFPFRRQRELASKGLIWLTISGIRPALFGNIQQNSRYDGNHRELRDRAKPTGRSTIGWTGLRPAQPVIPLGCQRVRFRGQW